MRKLLPLLAASVLSITIAYGQCPTGYKSAALNWDGLDYFSTAGYNMNSLSATMSPNQSFAFGKNRVTIAYANGITSVGENNGHTNSTGSYGAGEEVQYSGNGTMTLTFATPVVNLKYSLYDVDGGQSIAFSATNGALPTTVSLAGGSGLTIAGATATGSGNIKSDNANATLNVDVAGPVTSVTMIITQTATGGGNPDADYWLSDISGCITDAYTSNYYSISRPYNGMPAYVLAAVNNSVYMVDPATGKSKYLFNDGATSGTINSLAYDPYNKVAYFCWSLTNNGSANASTTTLHKYDFKTNTRTTITNNVNLYGLPTFNQGTESGAAAFYDGALYIGIEGGADNGNGGPRTTTTGIESIVWRMTFNGSGTPENITQVYATSGDTHDWGDFGISNDTLYDFNGESGGAHYQHVSLYSGYNTTVQDVLTLPRQAAVGWNGTVYNLGDAIGAYNLAGRTLAPQAIYSTPAIPNWSNTTAPSFGDAAEAFRPKADFGDAPNTFDRYDIDTLSPALHEISSSLRLGSNLDDEWNKPALVYGDATEDGGDEDGLAYARIFVNGSNYESELRVYNNTGGNATVCAWIDLNDDKMFQAGEGIMQTVGSSTTTQTINLVWNNPVSVLPNNSFTYLRIRITSQANGMTQANPTGYFADGEVEDYYVFVSNTPLDVKLTDFSAKRAGADKVSLAWTVTDEEKGTRYELQRSGNSQDWSVIHNRVAQNDNEKATYEHMDAAPLAGDNYYRLMITEADGSVHYSAIRRVQLEKPVLVQINPNPASANARLSIQADQRAPAHIRIVDMNGRTVYERDIVVLEGENGYALPVSQLPAGVYQTEVWMGTRRYTQQLIVRK